MSTSLHAVFNVVSGNVFFVIVIFNNRGRKMRFSENSQNSISEKSIFRHFEVIFLNVYFFSRAGWYFPVSTFKEEYFNEKMSFLAGLKKSYSTFRKSTDFGHFGLPGSTFKVIFSMYRKFSKNPRSVSWGRLLGTLC